MPSPSLTEFAHALPKVDLLLPVIDSYASQLPPIIKLMERHAKTVDNFEKQEQTNTLNRDSFNQFYQTVIKQNAAPNGILRIPDFRDTQAEFEKIKKVIDDYQPDSEMYDRAMAIKGYMTEQANKFTLMHSDADKIRALKNKVFPILDRIDKQLNPPKKNNNQHANPSVAVAPVSAQSKKSALRQNSLVKQPVVQQQVAVEPAQAQCCTIM